MEQKNEIFIQGNKEVEVLHLESLNLSLWFRASDCCGFFEYPNGNTRKASTSEILQFFISIALQNKG